MNETRAARFIFPQTLNERSGPVGLPTDETLAVFCPMAWGFYAGQYLTGLIMSVILWTGLKHFKKGKGSTWLFNLCYWSFPSMLFKGRYKVIPDSSYRLWLR
ncbi:type IV conjugative transfer system protein TraL [Enterobacter bugandensis]|uniref:type IV conjugative transfer system protein TraL n=1 Tax=Enterobacter bugandensis TaxID=881260 RepID=UPI0023AF8A45|nr:type IV conjugative transfer system protein TraL [Enterobacter bugandensis]MDE7590840.1 type IV conjugative transfer system protein TraL [Enterobacter bugandensis]